MDGYAPPGSDIPVGTDDRGIAGRRRTHAEERSSQSCGNRELAVSGGRNVRGASHGLGVFSRMGTAYGKKVVGTRRRRHDCSYGAGSRSASGDAECRRFSTARSYVVQPLSISSLGSFISEVVFQLFAPQRVYRIYSSSTAGRNPTSSQSGSNEDDGDPNKNCGVAWIDVDQQSSDQGSD